jgi:hypothetical protein
MNLEVNPGLYPCFRPLMILYSKNFKEIKGNRRIFENSSEKVIKKLSKSFKSIKWMESEETKQAYWDEILIVLGKDRRDIAIDQKSPTSEEFGALRDDRLITELGHHYAEYGALLRRKILENLPKSETEPFILRDQDIELRIEKEEAIYIRDDQGFETPLKSVQQYRQSSSSWTVSVSLVLSDQELPVVLSYAVLPIAPYRIEPGEERPVILNEQTTEQSEAIIRERFFDCFNSKTVSLEELKEKVVKFRYFFAHMSVYSRGSAAIGEWIEKAIYKSHGFSLEYKYPILDCDERPLADLDAFISLGPSEFIADYCAKAHVS